MKRRIHSFVWGGLVGAVLVAIGIATSVSTADYTNLAVWGVLGVMFFACISCLILKNNFLGEMMLSIFSWGFVRMPGLIYTLDLDGIIWLLTVKLLFWILGFILAALCGLLAVVAGLALAIFVYPYAIVKNIKDKE